MTELTQETLPEEITSREQFVREFIEEYKVDTRKFKGKTHMVCWKINVQGLSDEEIGGYIEAVQKNLEADMKKLSIADFYLPIFDVESKPSVMILICKYNHAA